MDSAVTLQEAKSIARHFSSPAQGALWRLSRELRAERMTAYYTDNLEMRHTVLEGPQSGAITMLKF